MEIHKIIKEIIIKNKAKLQLIQWATASGISSLLYSEYLRRIQQKITPKRLIFIPSIKTVEEFLHPEGQFMSWISNHLIDNILNNDLFIKYKNAPEFNLFEKDYEDALKTILDLHIVPNISKSIPSIIKTKFNLYDEKQDVFFENKNIDLFERKPLGDEQYSFIVEEIILQLLLLIPTMKKSIVVPDDNKSIIMDRNLIITINNEKAICGIHFNDRIINNKSVIDLLKFVTSTTFDTITRINLEDEYSSYIINTNPFNIVGIVKLEGIEISEGA